MRPPALLATGCAVLLLATSGCYYDSESELYPNTFCDTTNVTYALKVQPIVQSNCAIPGCHVPNGTGSGDFTAYTGVKAKVDNGSFADNVFVTKEMPPSSSLSPCDLRVLQIWLNAGAPNN